METTRIRKPTKEPFPGVWGGGNTCSYDPIICFWFCPLFLIKTTCSLKCLSWCSLDPKNLLYCSLDPPKYRYLSLFHVFVYLVGLSVHSKKSLFLSTSFLFLESAHATCIPHWLWFLSSQPWLTCPCDGVTSLVCWSRSIQKINMVATGQEIVKEKKILQGQGKVREFHFESGKIYIFEKSQGKV